VRTAGWAGAPPAGDQRATGETPPKLRAACGKRAASTGGILGTKSERKMFASTCLYSLYAWLFIFCCSFTVAQPIPSSMNADDSVGFCHKCSCRVASDSIASSSRMAGNVTSKETVMLYDLERAQKVLSGATVVDLPQLKLSLEPVTHPGEIVFIFHCNVY